MVFGFSEWIPGYLVLGCSLFAGFVVEESAPESHKYSAGDLPVLNAQFMNTVRKDHKILHTSLPLDIFVKSFENRMVGHCRYLLPPAMYEPTMCHYM